MPYPLIIDMAIHHFDMMRYFLSSDAVFIFGRSWNPAWSWYKGDASASLILNFANKVVVSYDGSWCSMGAETSWNAHWRFECENGVILMRDDEVYTQTRDGSLKAIRPLEPKYTDQSYLLHAFYDAVANGKTPATTCQDNIKSLGIVFDCIKSFESGAVVRSGA
jgi:predicted dehydrogenase